jgi:hypothetical protein
MYHRHCKKQETKRESADLSLSVRESIFSMTTIHGWTPRRVAQHHGVTIAEVFEAALQQVHDRAYQAGYRAGRAALWAGQRAA